MTSDDKGPSNVFQLLCSGFNLASHCKLFREGVGQAAPSE